MSSELIRSIVRKAIDKADQLQSSESCSDMEVPDTLEMRDLVTSYYMHDDSQYNTLPKDLAATNGKLITDEGFSWFLARRLLDLSPASKLRVSEEPLLTKNMVYLE